MPNSTPPPLVTPDEDDDEGTPQGCDGDEEDDE